MERSSQDPAKTEARPLEGVQILVADDEAVLRRVVASACERNGAVVVSVPSAEAAIMAVDSMAFDLLLIDVRMPVGGGAAVAQHIRTRHEHLLARCVFMSGDSREDTEATVGTGGGAIIEKPFRAPQLVERLTAALRKATGSCSRGRTSTLSPTESQG